jgi:hypothetical protein
VLGVPIAELWPGPQSLDTPLKPSERKPILRRPYRNGQSEK